MIFSYAGASQYQNIRIFRTPLKSYKVTNNTTIMQILSLSFFFLFDLHPFYDTFLYCQPIFSIFFRKFAFYLTCTYFIFWKFIHYEQYT